MITSWKVSNFKSIHNGEDLPLGPLTLFAGPNSSGKSTFIQSILLIAQTLSNKVGSRSVVLNGALTSLGQFDDLKSIGSESDQIVIKCTFRPLSATEPHSSRGGSASSARLRIYLGTQAMSLREVSFEIAFDSDPSSPERDVFQIHPRLFSTALDCTLRDEDNVDQRYSIRVHRSSSGASAEKVALLDNSPDADEHIRGALAYDVTLDEKSMSDVREEVQSAQPAGCVLRHFLPIRIIHIVDPIQEEARAITTTLQNSRITRSLSIMARPWRTRDLSLSAPILQILTDILNYEGIDLRSAVAAQIQHPSLFEPNEVSIPLDRWHDLLRSLSREDRLKAQQVLQDDDDLFKKVADALAETASPTDAQSMTMPYGPRQIVDSSRYIDNLFSTSVKYLGPLRDAPKPLYPLAPSADPYDIGLRGENTASVLEQHKNRRVQYIPSTQFLSSSIEMRTVNRTLEAAVVDWLQYLGIASSVESKDMGKLGHELRVALANSDARHDLTHVGVGVSQVLPILVMCLLAKTDSTLVFEQPELHLHPRVQSLLGDFFLSMALSNKQCIVETHSEYLIDRLRFRIAAAREDFLSEQAKIYFVEKRNAASTFREVKVNEYGAISDWPDGFFDQSQQQAEEIIRAAAQKRKVARTKEVGGNA